MATKNNKESFELNFLGFKIKSENPGSKTILIVAILAAFILIIVILLRPYGLIGIAAA